MKKKLNIMVIGIIIILLFVVLKNKAIINENLPLRMLIVKSNSMYPNLKTNDIVIIKKYSNYEKGDIITYSEDNYLITHRIIEKNNNDFITKGDNNNSEDNELVKLENIKGKVILRINRELQILVFLFLISLILFVFFNINKEA